MTDAKVRYLIFNTDKHQDDVTLVSDLSPEQWETFKGEADEYLTVVVDLVERKRYFGGRWEPCRVLGDQS